MNEDDEDIFVIRNFYEPKYKLGDSFTKDRLSVIVVAVHPGSYFRIEDPSGHLKSTDVEHEKTTYDILVGDKVRTFNEVQLFHWLKH